MKINIVHYHGFNEIPDHIVPKLQEMTFGPENGEMFSVVGYLSQGLKVAAVAYNVKGQIIGWWAYYTLSCFNHYPCRHVGFWVSEDYRCQGIARQLVRDAVQKVDKKNPMRFAVIQRLWKEEREKLLTA